MKISTSYLFDNATQHMSAIQNKLSTTQAQLSTSKQILSPSDSPEQAAAIQRLQGEIDRQTSDSALLNSSLEHFRAEETALKSTDDIVTRLKELGLQAANDTLGLNDRKTIGAEMKSLRSQLLSLGNSRDDSGNYLFSGTRVTTPAFSENSQGQVVYNGDQTQTRIPAGTDRTVQYTRSGTDVFSRVVRSDGTATGFFDAIDQMISAVDSSDTTGIQQGNADLGQIHDALTLSLAQSGSDQKVVQSQLDILDETQLRLKSSLSDVQDLDYTTAVTNMNKEMMALQAAMSSFSKISGLSLFDYIRGG